MKLLRAADRSAMPWKNGGGVTTEIAVSPEGADFDTFDWRISMAHVSADGPFSDFPGFDRTLAVIDGNGIRLEIAGQKSINVVSTSEPTSFRADLPTMGRLVNGPILDLNVMSRRGTVAHEVRCIELSPGARLRVEHPGPLRMAGAQVLATLIFCSRGSLLVDRSAPPESLAQYDALLLDKPATTDLVAIAPVQLHRVSLIRGVVSESYDEL